MTDAVANQEIELAGRTFKLTRPAAAYLQVVCEHIRNSRPDPLATAIAVASRVPRDAVAGLFAGALEQSRRRGVVSFVDIAEFEQTPEGLAFQFHLAASIHHGAEFDTFDAAYRFTASLGLADVAVLRATLDEVGR